MSNEREPRPWAEIEKTHSDIPEDIQALMIESWRKTGQQGSDVGVIARMYGVEWTATWRLLRLVLPARERKERGNRARQKRMAEKEAADKEKKNG